MENILHIFAAPTNTPTYTINPLDSNVIFSFGQFVIAILLVLLILCGIIGFVARVMGLTRLDIETEKWTSRFLLAFLYSVIAWLGLSMVISYFGKSILDTINGFLLLTGLFVSIVQRATSDQPSSNRTLAFVFGFLGVMIIWNFIYGAVMDALPASFMDAIGSEFHGDFFNDVLRYWGWM